MMHLRFSNHPLARTATKSSRHDNCLAGKRPMIRGELLRLESILTKAMLFGAVWVSATAQVGTAQETAESTVGGSFAEAVEPVLQSYCVDCHGQTDPDGALDLTAFDSTHSVEANFATWDLIRQRVADGEMPPADSGYEMEADEKAGLLNWIQQRRDDFIRQHAGDPGEVLAHRLSASEYNYTIADLTGVDIRPADSFPIDPSNTAGFDNSGESLVMTPSLMSKYIDAARFVSDHLLFLPDGLSFAPHPVVTDTDRDKFCVRQIVDYYDAQNTKVADYLYALGQRLRQGNDAEIDPSLSTKYLDDLTRQLATADGLIGPLAQIQSRLKSLPDDPAAAKEACEALAEEISTLREALVFDFPHLSVSGINSGSQPLVLWRNRQKASHRMSFNADALAELRKSDKWNEFALGQGTDELDEAQLRQSYEAFCRLFPDRFYVDRRGREYVGQKEKDLNREGEYRLLSAGFHSMMGYFRDDQPLYELMLTEEQQQEIDRLWFELDFVADVPARQHSGFIWFERAEGHYLVDSEFDPFRSADKNASHPDMIQRLSKVYIAKAERIGASEKALDAMRYHFDAVNEKVQAVAHAKTLSYDAHVNDLDRIAERAFRRPLLDSEREGLHEFYHALVDVDGLTHEDAIRDVIVSILISPHFCYRVQNSNAVAIESAVESTAKEENVASVKPLGAYELASRLSYFVWASMPDEALVQAAADGSLLDPETLRRECQRMLASSKAEGLAVEFGGNWLGFRQFKSHTGVDRNRFTEFDDKLQHAMFEEPVRFFEDVLARNGSVLDFLYADHTFVNEVLAKHYGIDETFDDETEWKKVDNAASVGRGGVLPMGVFLTKNSPGLRTSPVKRGFWVVRQLLGTHIPAPPPNVPELPEDESKLGELTLREVLAKHREHSSCSGCHEKFDSVGLVFEGFGPVGEKRELDLAGNPVDVVADFPDGSKHAGVSGLKEYIRTARQDEFVDNLCRKLLAYALGRSLIVSDEPLIEQMKLRLEHNDYAFSSMVETIVTSDQFLNRRG
ncbi:DUF1592 domain-containing protein [Rhodopirellula sp. MGV]|uniref:DUF1592 domain-containing protein n=1 Tax=Rhodopirellula sp. MGV TaxID=2023130 RepID=UPI000B97248F|nr:DUF1592 domain-containing protein [Rhodopirellula sp. MGV]OYP28230.1 hypothetical protein CGZ80_27290 [Rhodopirellula sp. MGV]PNY34232.1 DUF1592 domain-containing protein [Rhodopirellula baltica]